MPILPPDRLHEVIDALRAGEVVAIPTDTVYGIAAVPERREAVRRLAELKGRAAEQPVALLIDSVEAVAQHLEDAAVLERVRRFWPGALTAVVRVRAGFAPGVTTAAGTAGLRQPDDELARVVIRGCGGVLATTSANRHGEPPATSAEAAAAAFGEQIAGEMLVLDGGERPGGVASTVVDLTVEPPRVLREGPVSAEELGLAGEGA